MLSPRERRWLGRRLLHDVAMDLRPATVGLLAMTAAAAFWMLPLARGMPLARSETAVGVLAMIAIVLSAITLGWWIRIALDSLVQHLLVLRRCGRCGHAESDRGPRLASEEPFACRTWRCVECGSEWVASGTFVDAETRRDAA